MEEGLSHIEAWDIHRGKAQGLCLFKFILENLSLRLIRGTQFEKVKTVCCEIGGSGRKKRRK